MDKEFKKLRRLYLARAPTEKLHELLDNVIKENYNHSNQALIYSNTCNNERSREYPLPRSYSLKFLKELINKIENSHNTVNESIYNHYIEKLNSQVNDEFHFVTYSVCNQEFTFKQCDKLVSDGTTGLKLWEASFQLFEQIYANSDKIFKNKRILEIGSGTGLTGVLISSLCDIKSYTFTDHHEKVLDLIKENLEINGFNLDKSPNKKFNKFYEVSPKVNEDEFGSNSFEASSFNGFSSDFILQGPMDLKASSKKKDVFDFSFSSNNEDHIFNCSSNLDLDSENIQSTKDDFSLNKFCSSNLEQNENVFKVDIKAKSKQFDERVENFNEKISDFDQLLKNFEEKLVLLDENVNKIKKHKFNSNKNLKNRDKDVNVTDLNWYSSNNEITNKLNELKPDYVIGSDIIYDPLIIPDLIRVFKLCLSDQSCGIIIVCSIRNEDTIKQFEQQLRKFQKEEDFKIQRVRLSGKLSYFDCVELTNTKFVLYNIRSNDDEEEDQN